MDYVTGKLRNYDWGPALFSPQELFHDAASGQGAATDTNRTADLSVGAGELIFLSYSSTALKDWHI